MKKLILFTILALAGALFVSSCASLTKRHYRKGFYVEYKKHPMVVPIANKTVQAAENANHEKEIAKEFKAGAPDTKFISEEKNNSGEKEKSAESTPPHASIDSKQDAHAHIDAEDLFSLKKMNETTRAVAQKIVAPEAGLVGAALSLFWIVILVVLIIYIAGLLFNNFGLGGLIHILAVIVLVLLILWLLRIL
jgi:hypothetical protein